MSQEVSTLNQPIFSNDNGPPLVIRTVTPRSGANVQVEGGSSSAGKVVSEYVLLSVLPPELKERVVTAIKALAQV